MNMRVLSENTDAPFKKVGDIYIVIQLQFTERVYHELDVPEKHTATPSPVGKVHISRT
jgi:hypothetical protein